MTLVRFCGYYHVIQIGEEAADVSIHLSLRTPGIKQALHTSRRQSQEQKCNFHPKTSQNHGRLNEYTSIFYEYILLKNTTEGLLTEITDGNMFGKYRMCQNTVE